MADTLEFTGERVVPWAEGMRQWPHVLRDHINRYSFALPYVAGKSVCDIGCGTGYGAFLMSFVARHVTAFDVSQEAIQFSLAHFKAPNLFRFRADATDSAAQEWPQADVYTCFEVLEHLGYPEYVYLRVPQRATFIWSVPIDDPGQFHRHVFTPAQAWELVPGSVIYYQSANGDIELNTYAQQPPKYVIGVRRATG